MCNPHAPEFSGNCPDEPTLQRLSERARRIRLVLTDVDGVLTSSHIFYGPNGERFRPFSTRDGAGVGWLRQSGIPVGFISALEAGSTRDRARDLGVEEVHLGSGEKLPIFQEICERRGLQAQEVAYLGDDLVDLPILLRVGLALCPLDSAPEVQHHCDWVIPRPGGVGVLRAAAELVLRSQGRWQEILDGYCIKN